jgi:hypothetical protein
MDKRKFHAFKFSENPGEDLTHLGEPPDLENLFRIIKMSAKKKGPAEPSAPPPEEETPPPAEEKKPAAKLAKKKPLSRKK